MAKALKKKTIRRTGCGQDEAGNWYVEIQAKDPSGRPAKWCFSMAALSRDEKPLWEFLGSKGHIISQRQRPQLRHVLLGLPGKNPDFAMATMMGWHEGAFVTPHDIYGDPNDRVHAQFPEALDRRKWEPRGELSRWRTEIAGICRGNPLLRFAVMVAFVPPVLRLLGLPTVGFSWVGDPSLGKSSALALAGSVWGGNPERPMGFCETLLKTANAFDKVGRRYRHTFLPMDEAHLASAQTLADLVHRLAAGESKETAIGETLPTHTSLVYVLTSNQPLAEILIKHKVHFDESYNARLIEIPVVKPRGMFHRLPNDLTAHDFAGRIAKAVTDQYGTAIDRYLTKLTSEYAEDKDALITWLRARMAWMERRLAINGNIPGEARRGQYFCVAYAAACLASRYRAIPWSRKDSGRAVRIAYRAHQKLVDRTTEEPPDPIKRVRRYIRKRRHKLIDTRGRNLQLTGNQIVSAPGFIIQRQHGADEYAFSPNRFHRKFKSKSKELLNALKAAKLLRHDKGKLTAKYPLGPKTGRVRLYCVSDVVLRT